MRPRIAVIGAGAVGGYVGGHLARTGQDVTLIDPWPARAAALVEAVKRVERGELAPSPDVIRNLLPV